MSCCSGGCRWPRCLWSFTSLAAGGSAWWPRLHWDKLPSKLQKELLQAADRTPPAQYRDKINDYFQGVVRESAKVTR